MITQDPVTHRSRTEFGRLWLAAAVANLGDGMGKVAVPLLAASVTRDPVLVGGLSSMFVLPYLVFGIPAGALADRFERRHAMIAANLFRALCLSLLCVGLVNGSVHIAWLFVLTFVLAAAECLYDASADGAVPVLVPVKDLDRANSRLQGVITVTNDFLGAPVGGFLFAAGLVYPFAAQLAGFLLAMAVVTTLPRMSPHLAPSPEKHATGGKDPSEAVRKALPLAPSAIGRDMKAGVSWLMRHRSLRGLLVLTAVCGVALELAQGTMVLYAVVTMKLPVAAYGLFASSLAIGALVGVTIAPRLSSAGHSRCRVMLGALVIQPFCLVAIGFAPSVVVAFVSIAVLAGAVAVWNVMSATMRQALTPTHLYGRVHGAWKSVVWGLLPLGAWGGGFIAKHSGLRAPWLVAACLLAVMLVVAPPILRRACLEAEAVIGRPPREPRLPKQGGSAGRIDRLHHQRDLFALQSRQHHCR